MISEKYKSLYLSTSIKQIKDFSALLLDIEQNPSTRDLAEELFRLIHSMKGAAATMGYTGTVSVFHALEDIIQASYHKDFVINKNIIDIFFETLALLKKNLNLIDKKNKELDFSEHIKKLVKIFEDQDKVKSLKKSIVKRDKPSFIDELSHSTEIAVPAAQLNDIQNIFDDLMISVMKTKSLVKHVNNKELLASSMQADKLMSHIMRQMQDLRIIALSQIFSPLNYLVREIAREENKKVKFNVKHNGLSVDKSVLDELVEILIQLIRNSIVHGITTRQKNGSIELEANLADDKIHISLKDNGRGIDWQYIINTAIKKKIITKAQAKKMTLDQIKQLIFTSGISSSTEISTRSGRGIGLAVVQNKIKELGGNISVESNSKGTIFSMEIPLPFSMFRSLDFKFANYNFAIALSYIDEVVRLDDVKDFSKVKNFNYQKTKYKIISLANIFSLKNFAAPTKYLALLDYHGKKIALPIHSNIEEGSVVAKKMPKVLKNKKYIKGVAVGADGKPTLIINLEDLI